MIPVSLNEEIRKGVEASFPSLQEMKNRELKEKIIDAWAYSLQINGYTKVEEMPGSGMPEASALGDQSMHINAVVYNALSIYDNLSKAYQMDLGLDRELLLACAICHDIGKPYEYNKENRARWSADKKHTGFPNVRHPAYGAFIALTAELPEEVVHVCANHSPEGRFVTRSGYATIVHYADDGSWFSLASLLNLDIPKL